MEAILTVLVSERYGVLEAISTVLVSVWSDGGYIAILVFEGYGLTEAISTALVSGMV